MADALTTVLGDVEVIAPEMREGADADDEWFYLELTEGTRVQELLDTLYGEQRAATYTYTYTRSQRGETGRLARFDPANAVFVLNADHPFVRAHDDDATSQTLLEDVVTAEALLEVYLREQGLSPGQVGEILARRDTLFRSLTRDRAYSDLADEYSNDSGEAFTPSATSCPRWTPGSMLGRAARGAAATIDVALL